MSKKPANGDGRADGRTDGRRSMAGIAGLPSSPPQPVHAYRSAQFLQQLESEIRQRQQELDALLQARDVLLGTPMGAAVSPRHTTHATTPTTVADAVEQLLLSTDSMHVGDLLDQLRARFNMKTTHKNLVNTLNRWVTRRKRFKRVRPNTYALVSLASGALISDGNGAGNGAASHDGAARGERRA